MPICLGTSGWARGSPSNPTYQIDCLFGTGLPPPSFRSPSLLSALARRPTNCKQAPLSNKTERFFRRSTVSFISLRKKRFHPSRSLRSLPIIRLNRSTVWRLERRARATDRRSTTLKWPSCPRAPTRSSATTTNYFLRLSLVHITSYRRRVSPPLQVRSAFGDGRRPTTATWRDRIQKLPNCVDGRSRETGDDADVSRQSQSRLSVQIGSADDRLN